MDAGGGFNEQDAVLISGKVIDLQNHSNQTFSPIFMKHMKLNKLRPV